MTREKAEALKDRLHEARNILDDLLGTFFDAAVLLDRYSEYSDQAVPALIGLMFGNDVNPAAQSFNIDTLIADIEAATASEEAAA